MNKKLAILITSLVLSFVPIVGYSDQQPGNKDYNPTDYTMNYYTNNAEYGGAEKVYQADISGGNVQYIRRDESLYDSVFEVLKNNLWFVVVVCVLVIVVMYSIILLFVGIFKWLGKRFEHTEYLEIGKLKIKNKNYKPENTNSQDQSFNVRTFVTMLDIILSNEMKMAITKTMDIMNTIHSIENIYDSQCESIFRNTFTTLKNEYHERLVSYASEVTGFTMDSIHRTREYFFISDMLHSAEIFWMDQSKDIISRNGFVEIVDDKCRCGEYIKELEDCIWRSIDIRKLEATVLKKKDIDEILIDIMRTTASQLENMFMRLGSLKKSMLSKKSEKMSIVDKAISTSVDTTLNNIKYRFFGTGLNPENNESGEVVNTANT